MPTEIKMPQMGESIAEGTLTRWFKKVGENVKRDEPLFEISTDKVDAEVPAPADGVLEKILVEEGTTVEVNTVVALLGSNGESPAPAVVADEQHASAAVSPANEAPARKAPQSPEPASQGAPSAATAVAVGEAPGDSIRRDGDGLRKVRSSPLVRRIARERGIADLSVVPGTGAGGRVTKEDILGFLDGRQAQPGPATAPSTSRVAQAPGSALPVLNLPRDHAQVEPLSLMRRKIAEHMVHSRRTSAHVHSVFEMDMTRIVSFRERQKKAFQERHGIKLTYMPFFIQATCRALQDYKNVNASLDGDNVIAHNSVHMGIAVALDWGLIVPVIKNADELNLVGLQKRVVDLASRARSKQLLPDQVA